eukprot:110464-Amphidinium_carterae.1
MPTALRAWVRVKRQERKSPRIDPAYCSGVYLCLPDDFLSAGSSNVDLAPLAFKRITDQLTHQRK